MAEFDYQKNHARSYYATQDFGPVKKGMFMVVHNKDEEQKAKQLGYTSTSYVRSSWPKTFYNKETGATQAVGRLEWTEEQNASAVRNLGDKWTDEHVPVPETKPASDSDALLQGATGGGNFLLALGEIAASIKAMRSEIRDDMTGIEIAIEKLDEARKATEGILASLEDRLSTIENAIDAAAATPPAPPAPETPVPTKAEAKAKAKAEAEKSKSEVTE